MTQRTTQSSQSCFSSLPGAMIFASLLSLGACIVPEGQPPMPGADVAVPDAGAKDPEPVDPDAPFLRVTPNRIKLGETARLSFQDKYGVYCSIMQGIGYIGPEGEVEVSPTRTMTYEFKCEARPGDPLGDGGGLTLTTTLEVVDADLESPCGVQGNDVIVRPDTRLTLRDGNIPEELNLLLDVSKSSVACAFTCDKEWILPVIVDSDGTPQSLPTTITDSSSVRLRMPDANGAQLGDAECRLTTAGGDIAIEVAVVPAM